MKTKVALTLAALAVFPSVLSAKEKSAAAPQTIDHISCKGGAREIRVIVRNVKTPAGVIIADLYAAKEEGFLRKEGRIGRARYAAQSPVTAFCMTAPSDAPHAISVYQDKNVNTNFDKTGIGLPAEPYGVSNNPKMRFGAPKIGEATFPLGPDGAIVDIKLRG